MKRIIPILLLSIALCSGSIGSASNEGTGVMARHPSPSPTGTEVAFEADFDGPLNLWITGINGNNLRKLTNTPGIDEEAAWSPDGTTIAFASTRTGTTDIWTIHPDGSDLIQLTSQALNNRQPAWSPDGQRIAFVSDRGGTNDIWIMNADGSSPQRVTALPGEENHPSVSPTGDEIVFSETINDVATLMIVNVDGSNLHPLTTGGDNDWNPSWSTRGILFSSNRGGTEHWMIWHIQPDGTDLAQVGNTIGLDPVSVPNGRILFSDEVGKSAALSAITLLDPTSGVKTIVTTVQGLLVPIDIRPGGVPNPINPKSKGNVPVAILSRNDFNAPGTVDKNSLTFGRTGDERSLAFCNGNGEDVNGDGLPDLVCHFKTDVTGFQSGDTIGILRAITISSDSDAPGIIDSDVPGIRIEGRDSIKIVP